MPNVYFDFMRSDDEIRRQLIFGGNILLTSPQPGVVSLCTFARRMIANAFSQPDPRLAQFDLAVEDYIGIIAPLKSAFTNHVTTKELIRDVLSEFGCDLDNTYFDVPRLRIVTHGGYLTAGVGYAYRPHRDIWYASPSCQINWWIPIYQLEAEQALVFYPGYWNRPVRNSSGEFDYDEWCREGRTLAASQVKVDTRKHPLAQEEISTESELRLVCDAGATICFSSGQLHATAPNPSGATRFSLDFRTINLKDLHSGNGAHNIDSASIGTTLADFISARDFSPLPSAFLKRTATVNR